MRRSFLAVSLIALTATASAEPSAPASPDQTIEVSFTSAPGRLGIAAIQISPALRSHLGAPSDRGVLVDSVRGGSVAEKAGMQVGDIVVGVDGRVVRSASEMIGVMATRKKGEALAIEVMRGGTSTKLTATLDRDPMPTMPATDLKSFGLGDHEMRRMLEEMRRRIDQLERGGMPGGKKA